MTDLAEQERLKNLIANCKHKAMYEVQGFEWINESRNSLRPAKKYYQCLTCPLKEDRL